MDIEERYKACMLLGAAGDALGFKNARWEFMEIGEEIHKELKKLGGIENIDVELPNWRVSDDSVMHLATAEALGNIGPSADKEVLYCQLAAKYVACIRDDMSYRSPGARLIHSCNDLRPGKPYGYVIPFNARGGGCGAAMRAMCIGLRYPRPEDLDDLIAVSIESGRMTHNHPTGYLGALAAALFTAYALQSKPEKSWGAGLLSTLPKALDYIRKIGRDVEQNEEAWSYFTNKWSDFLRCRKITDGIKDPIFPKKYDVKARDKEYASWSYSGWGGASGHDSTIIAYDAILGANKSWKELCDRAMFHGGDSDSTGTIAACWFGAANGFESVPPNNYKNVEYRDRFESLAKQLFKISQTGPALTPEEKQEGANVMILLEAAPDVTYIPPPESELEPANVMDLLRSAPDVNLPPPNSAPPSDDEDN